MYSLAFDTTGASCSVALYKENHSVEVFEKSMDFGQSETLIPAIRDILENNKLSVGDLSLITVCTGPGSFTGVRSSISAARAFGIAKENLEVMGISAFEAYVSCLQEEELSNINVVVIETKRDDFYYQLFDKNRHKISEAKAACKEDIIEELKSKKLTIVGDGVERFLFNPTGLQIAHLKMLSNLPIENLALLGIKKFENKEFNFPKPVYLRAPDVCVKKF